MTNKFSLIEQFRAALIETLPATWGSQAKLAREVNIPPSYLNNILKGNQQGSDEVRRKLAEALGYPGRQYEDFLEAGQNILQGKGSPLKAQNNSPLAPEKEPANINADILKTKAGFSPSSNSPVPFVSLAECGIHGFEKIEIDAYPLSASPLYLGPNALAVMALGDSMLPAGILPKHICYCDPEQIPIRGDAVYVATKAGLATIKVFIGWGETVGAQPDFLRLKGWLDPKKNNDQNFFYKDIHKNHIATLATVMYVKRRL